VAANREVTRDRIYEAATELFARDGYHATSVAQISAAAGIQTGALYHHIKSKEEVLWEILRRYTGKALAAATSVTASGDDPVVKLSRLIDIHVEVIVGHRREVAIQTRDAAALNPEHSVQLQALRQGVQDCWEGVAARCWPDKRPPEVRVVASGLLGMLNSLWYWFRPERGDTAEGIARQLRDIVIAGLPGANTL
jgi:AcrR family transcriptional regulator